MNNMFEKFKAQFNENPLAAISVTAFATTAVAKLIDALSAAKGRKAYAKQIDYKVRNRK